MNNETVNTLKEYKIADPLAHTELVVIIPTYRHPVFLVEALDSLLNQTVDASFAIVVCSDGCPLPETDIVASLFCLSNPHIVYLRKPNGGPSAARNYAIDYSLERFREMKVVYFLDSDNRLTGSALSIGFRALMSSPDVGWVYSHIDSFGITWSGNYEVPYSPLLHVVHENFCDTGSFVRREVFEAGVRFDEDARSGFEDWDFWLQCLAKGFVGKHVLFGFSYRQRPESRYRGINRSRAQMVERLRQRHWPITSPTRLLEWEHETNPRYLLTHDVDRHVAFTDPTAVQANIDPAQMASDIWAYFSAADVIWSPAFFVFGAYETVRELARWGLIHNLLWRLERAASEADFAVVTVEYQEGAISLENTPAGAKDAGSIGPNARLWVCTHRRMAEILTDEGEGWDDVPASAWPEQKISEIKLWAPLASARTDENTVADRSLAVMLATIKAWRHSEFRSGAGKRWMWRYAAMPSRHMYYDKLCEYLSCKRYVPRLGHGKTNIGIVVPIASFGGAEKVAYALARELRSHGQFRVHLFVVGAARMNIVSEFENAFDTLNFLADGDFPTWGGPEMAFGEPFFMPDAPEVKTAEVIGFLGALDFVVNCHSAPFNSIVGALKPLGIKTASYLHLTDVSPWGRSSGHPYLTLGFEHAYDLLITCSRRLADELHALGVPGDKILAVRNAASFAIPPVLRRSARAARALARAGRRLRCLYIGRLDRQKGLERLLGTIEQTARERLPVEFRLVGASIVDSVHESLSRRLEEMGVSIEPPIYESAKLIEAYLWADALLLPSRWEGAPLVIPECQQLGAIPICTNVGAVSELIDDGVDGLIVDGPDDEAVADRMSAAIRRILEDDGLRRSLARAAIDRGEANGWSENFRELVAYMKQATAT